jgi:2-polyprenyl-3-methyl-5-hydroxy-6-metoxy-1,4-benzoquinol methylase
VKISLLVQRLFEYVKYYGLKATIGKTITLFKEIMKYLQNRNDIILFLSYRHDLGGVDSSEDNFIIERIEFSKTNNIDIKLHQCPYEYALPMIRPNDRVLEIGCNWGYGTKILADCARFVAAFDLDAEVVKKAQELYGGSNIGFFVHDAGRTFPFPDEDFDLVFSSEVIEHLSESAQEVCFAEIARVLRPEGTLFLKTPNVLYDPITHGLNSYHLHVFTYNKLQHALMRYFKEVNLYTYEQIFTHDIKRESLPTFHYNDDPNIYNLPNRIIVSGKVTRRVMAYNPEESQKECFLAICRK